MVLNQNEFSVPTGWGPSYRRCRQAHEICMYLTRDENVWFLLAQVPDNATERSRNSIDTQAVDSHR